MTFYYNLLRKLGIYFDLLISFLTFAGSLMCSATLGKGVKTWFL